MENKIMDSSKLKIEIDKIASVLSTTPLHIILEEMKIAHVYDFISLWNLLGRSSKN